MAFSFRLNVVLMFLSCFHGGRYHDALTQAFTPVIAAPPSTRPSSPGISAVDRRSSFGTIHHDRTHGSWTHISELCSTNGPIIVIELDDDDDDDDDEEGTRIIQFINVDEEDEEDEEEDEEEEEEEEDPYTAVAESEFKGKDVSASPASDGGLLMQGPISRMADGGGDGDDASTNNELTTNMDWGGALGSLRERMDDVESGKSQDPSHVLFRLMSKQSPNQAIGSFVTSAKPQVVQAMSGAVSSLLGGLSNPMSGVEMIVEASGEKMGSLCFQLQMTGYMFRNAEYVMALKELMQLSGSATLQDYKDAFDRLDADSNGFIEAEEVNLLLDDVYKGKTPAFEIDTFVKFFDQNKDGRISWEEFERGLGSAMAEKAERTAKLNNLLMPAQERNKSDDDDDDDDNIAAEEPEVSGTIEIEMDDGKVIQMDAKEYISSLKEEARKLKDTLRREKFGISPHDDNGPGQEGADAAAAFIGGLSPTPQQGGDSMDTFGGIANYIASRQGDVKALTEGISPEIVDTMKMLVDFVLDGGADESGSAGGGAAGSKAAAAKNRGEMSMEIPASALQQLALWQLILGYRLREAEAKGEYLRLLE